MTSSPESLRDILAAMCETAATHGTGVVAFADYERRILAVVGPQDVKPDAWQCTDREGRISVRRALGNDTAKTVKESCDYAYRTDAPFAVIPLYRTPPRALGGEKPRIKAADVLHEHGEIAHLAKLIGGKWCSYIKVRADAVLVEPAETKEEKQT